MNTHNITEQSDYVRVDMCCIILLEHGIPKEVIENDIRQPAYERIIKQDLEEFED